MAARRPKVSIAIGFVVAVAAILACAASHAQDSWSVMSGDWSVAGNWNAGLPNSNSDAYIANGGTASVTTFEAASNYYVYVGDPGSTNTGAIQMSGGGLSSYSENVGNVGAGTFDQTGGLNSVAFLTIGSLGRYQFSGGILQITGDFDNEGIFDATNSTGVLNVTSNSIIDLSQATLVNTGSMSLNIGPGSLLLLPSGFNPATAFASFSDQGLVHNVGAPGDPARAGIFGQRHDWRFRKLPAQSRRFATVRFSTNTVRLILAAALPYPRRALPTWAMGLSPPTAHCRA